MFDGPADTLLLDAVLEVECGKVRHAKSQKRISSLLVARIEICFRATGVEQSRQVTAERSLEFADITPVAGPSFDFGVRIEIGQSIKNGQSDTGLLIAFRHGYPSPQATA